MTDPVNPDLGRRERKALQTRRRVLAAAETLFTRDGYAATTIAAIAEEGDVAVQTVYGVFGNKRTVLTELLAARTVGDAGGASSLNQRADWLAVEQEPDPHRQITLLAEFATRVGQRLGGLYVVLASAAAADPEIGALFDRQQRLRYADQARIAQALAAKGALRPGLSDAHATDIMWAVANPRMYQTLVVERRWEEGAYATWLAGVLASSLLG